MIMKARGFRGGYRFRNFEGAPEPELVAADLPEELTVPMRQGFGAEVAPLVKAGDRVLGGQVIGIDENSISSPVHAPASGNVHSVKTMPAPGGRVLAVVIRTDGEFGWEPLDPEDAGPGLEDPEAISRRVYLSGAGSLGRSGIPTGHCSSPIGPEEVEHLIIQGIGSDVYGVSLDFLMRDEGLDRFLEGVRILRRLLPGARVHVALNRSRTGLIRLLQEQAPDLVLYPVEPRYPRHFDEVLVPALLKKPFPSGFRSSNIGVVVLDLQAVFHVYDAVVDRKPLIERVIALCGRGFAVNRYVRARIGTPVSALQTGFSSTDGEEAAVRLVAGSLISGRALDGGAPVEKDFSAVIAVPEKRRGGFLSFAMPGFRKDSFTSTFVSKVLPTKKDADTNLHGEERPCIFCGYCEDVCPAGIIPHIIHRHVSRGVVDEFLVSWGTFRCVECGLCSYVCPSKIKVSRSVQEAKEALRGMGLGEPAVIAPKFRLKGAGGHPGPAEQEETPGHPEHAGLRNSEGGNI